MILKFGTMYRLGSKGKEIPFWRQDGYCPVLLNEKDIGMYIGELIIKASMVKRHGFLFVINSKPLICCVNDVWITKPYFEEIMESSK